MNNTSSLNHSHDIQLMGWDNLVKWFAMVLITHVWSVAQPQVSLLLSWSQ